MGRFDQAQNAFFEIYSKDLWNLRAETIGPQGEDAGRYSALIQAFVRENDVRSVVDFGCGFWKPLSLLDWEGIEYDGYDLVEPVIEVNARDYGAKNIRFHTISEETQLPPTDLLICKDVLQHLPTEDARYLVAFAPSVWIKTPSTSHVRFC